MANSLSNLADNFVEGIHKLNVNMDMIIKTEKHAELNTTIVSAVLMI